MSDEELFELWRESAQDLVVEVDREALLTSLETRCAKLERTLRWADRADFAGGLIAAAVLAFLAWNNPDVVAGISALSWVGAAMFALTFALYHLGVRATRLEEPGRDATLCELFRHEARALERRARILGWVGWYGVGAVLGLAIFILGCSVATGWKIGAAAAAAVIAPIFWIFVRQYTDAELGELRRALARTAAELEDTTSA